MDRQKTMYDLIDKDRGFVTVKLSQEDISRLPNAKKYQGYFKNRQLNTLDAQNCLKQLVVEAVATKCKGESGDIRGVFGLDLYMY